MSAGWGWVDFSTQDRNRISSIMNLLREKGVLDELGISVLRDAISNELFPGLSTIQTRAKYFIYTPVIIRRFYQNQERMSLTEYFNKKESEYIQITAKAYKEVEVEVEGGGIFGITLEDAKDLQRKPSVIYWNGQQILGVIDIKQKNVSLSQYLRVNNLDIDHSHKASDDDSDAGLFDKTGIYIPKEIVDNFDPTTIDLTLQESQYLRDTFIKTLKESNQNSLLYHLLTDKKLYRAIKNKNLDFASFYEKNKTYISDIEGLNGLLRLAFYFSELIYGAHLLYNYTIQKKINALENQHSEEWVYWLNNCSEIIANIDISLLFSLIENDPHKSKMFIENWIILLKTKDQKKLEELIIDQEFLSKRERARLKKNVLPADELKNWIGMGKLNYRYYQAKILITDLSKAGIHA